MRIAYLAAGAAGMYCGSCIRDLRVVATLRAMGRDVVLMPLYTPLRSDEHELDATPVYFGGVNAYLQQKSALFRHTPWILDRLLDRPWILNQLGKRAGSTAPHDLGELTISVLSGERGNQRKELRKLVAGLREIRPDVVVLPNLMFAGVAETLRRELAAPIVCTLSGEDLFIDGLPAHHREQALRLISAGAAHIDLFIAVTRYYAQHAARCFGLPVDRIRVVPLGVSVEEFAAAPVRETNGVSVIGHLARVCPAKGLHLLVDAWLALRTDGLDVRLIAAGHLGAGDREYFERIWRRVQSSGHAAAFEFRGEVTRAEKISLLSSVDLFSAPSVYHEAKGLHVLEAMAAGAPVVQPRHGSFIELVEDTGGGLLYDSADPAGLKSGLIEMMKDFELRRSASERGRSAVFDRYTDRHMAQNTWAVFEEARCLARL